MDIERAVEDFVGKGKDLFRRRSCTFSPSKRPVLRFRSSAPTESSQSRLLTDARTVEPSTTMLMRTENQTKKPDENVLLLGMWSSHRRSVCHAPNLANPA
jgi:hypothetical protein